MMWFIPGNVPALKNSKRIVSIPVKGKPGIKRPMLLASKAHADYVKSTRKLWSAFQFEFRDAVESMPKPLHVKFFFHRKSKHRFDYTNALDTIQDLMVDNKWIPDDNADELVPVIAGYEYNKEKPGVTISI